MPYKYKPTKRLYWDIGQVAEHLNEATSALRYWEQEFKWLKPKRNRKGKRKYSRKDLHAIITIRFLIRSGITIQGIRDFHMVGCENELAEFIANKFRNFKKIAGKPPVEQYPLTPDEAWEPDHPDMEYPVIMQTKHAE